MSGFLGEAYASDATLRELCLATSAAPTYFKPKEVDSAPMLDGGLSMNNPDVLAPTEVAPRRPELLAQLEMLSIGTGADAPRDPRAAEKKGLAWAKTLPEYMMPVQERTASAQAARVASVGVTRTVQVAGRGRDHCCRGIPEALVEHAVDEGPMHCQAHQKLACRSACD